MTEPHRLSAESLSLAYGDRVIVDGLDLTIPSGAITAIVGGNGCGKSTLLRALARLISPRSGQVILDGKALHGRPTKEIARTLGLLPQSPVAPEGIAVADLVGRGRHPHQRMLARFTAHDYDVVARSLAATGITEFADRSVDELSGGQRQRVWIAMALAQETDILLLDEPTTFLDLTHQIEVLDLLTDLNREQGTTIVMVLHDINLARATRIISSPSATDAWSPAGGRPRCLRANSSATCSSSRRSWCPTPSPERRLCSPAAAIT